MPYKRQFTSGEGLLRLTRPTSKAIEKFEGIISCRPETDEVNNFQFVSSSTSTWKPKYIIAIDGSNIAAEVNNGYPCADAGILTISVLVIFPELLVNDHYRLTPKDVRNMEQVISLEAVMPGANVIRKNIASDSPNEFFRHKIYNELEGKLDPTYETLLDTLRLIVKEESREIKCPLPQCENKFNVNIRQDKQSCVCESSKKIYCSDTLRIHERFNEDAPNGEAFGEFRHVLELLSLVNIMRNIVENNIRQIPEIAFVLDGPLAVFGHPAWLMPYIRDELERLNEIVRRKTGKDIVLFGIEKTGVFVEYLSRLDKSGQQGPRARIKSSKMMKLTSLYIQKNVVPNSFKEYGKDTYFGRKVLYKSKNEGHYVVNVAMLNKASRDLNNDSDLAFPRLTDILNIIDSTGTYLYQDGFLPLVRSHSHAAIPLKMGTTILREILARNLDGSG